MDFDVVTEPPFAASRKTPSDDARMQLSALVETRRLLADPTVAAVVRIALLVQLVAVLVVALSAALTVVGLAAVLPVVVALVAVLVVVAALAAALTVVELSYVVHMLLVG